MNMIQLLLSWGSTQITTMNPEEQCYPQPQPAILKLQIKASNHHAQPKLSVIGTLRGVSGRGVRDYTSLNRPY